MQGNVSSFDLMQKIVSDEDRILLVNSEQNNVVPKSAIAS
ncbi:hypothetical protein B4114_2614 [Geobacillus stearothermophilus]|uniref:Uncharacterized protein n=1 Tax=Geobacillus stearothermophilus TaxID=1422 RepID=A0A150ND03_GEOSE|nr:hypothetical protein B4114_2614 [Geobacillus stearothermophilus]